MKLDREIRIQRLQTKNRMTGQTFNPSGITSKQIQDRESVFVAGMNQKTQQERADWWKQSEAIRKMRSCSWEWDWCAFERNFVFNGQVN